jgi:hypothetical protein
MEENHVSATASMDIPQLEALIRTKLFGRVRDLRLVMQDEGLVLRGNSRTYYAKQLAQEAVMEAQHLPLVANEIRVQNSTVHPESGTDWF